MMKETGEVFSAITLARKGVGSIFEEKKKR
jgi:hypothetical protein